MIETSPSHLKAREVSPNSLLDIGSGGGLASFATDAKLVIGVDHQQEMLDMYEQNAKKFHRDFETHLGFWPNIAAQVPSADVVAAYHVVYNVQEIERFVLAMDNHAKSRVVIEMPQHHPLSNLNAAWKHFWNLERPNSPSYLEFLDVIHELGIQPNIELWDSDIRSFITLEKQAEYNLIRLCLPKSKLHEMTTFMKESASPNKRKLATIWWDK